MERIHNLITHFWLFFFFLVLYHYKCFISLQKCAFVFALYYRSLIYCGLCVFLQQCTLPVPRTINRQCITQWSISMYAEEGLQIIYVLCRVCNEPSFEQSEVWGGYPGAIRLIATWWLSHGHGDGSFLFLHKSVSILEIMIVTHCEEKRQCVDSCSHFVLFFV